ncbi:hypothetical protein BUZ56_05955 [Staphylococcus hyicus]|nr:DUF805 domain-containing protein [Staphylococcus hyicus]MCQ9300653.1 DUF805 domain-containing protein [Staphylococcus hyicus]MDP4461455.1 DUF805 domain-containing protein [Staphylococcus hyicus]MDP4469658.1 DUF805 domain-containing protein [Staphylococcus hyicus]MDY3697460.1 DUF805 domain-containing protein [Staphylococcus hyicus]NJH80450.1 DUF805 domain-containing protein [Staphylococcus hyicus]
MNQTQNVLSCYKLFWTRAFDFRGRATRKEFWHPLWINLVLIFLLEKIAHEVVVDIFSLIIFIPALTVMARRLHDTNHTMFLAIVLNAFTLIVTIAELMNVSLSFMSDDALPMGSGYFVVIIIFIVILLIMTIYSLILMCIKGDENPNKYGADGTCGLLNSTTTNK